MSDSPTFRIPALFNGPPDSANGGITCGMLAAHLDAPVVQVTLRQPPPLETDLRVEQGRLYVGQVLLAEAVPGELDVTAPPAVGLARAEAAATSYGGLVAHPFPTCFVCGTLRSDGLGLAAGPVADGLVAAVWTPRESTALMVWAALDCPGGWSADLPGRPLVLGRMTCRIDDLPEVGVPYVVQGWHVRSEGRKVLTGTALYDGTGRVLAAAGATWITITT